MTCSPQRAIKANLKIYGAATSIALSIFCISLFWLPISEFTTRHPGIVLVLLGVLGEGFEIAAKIFFVAWFEKYERKIEICGGIFWLVVMIGLSMEIPEAASSDVEIATLSNDVAQATVLVAKLTQTNLVLSTNLERLRATNQWQMEQNRLDTLPRIFKGVRGAINVLQQVPFPQTARSVVISPFKTDECKSVVAQIKYVLVNARWNVLGRNDTPIRPPGWNDDDPDGMPLNEQDPTNFVARNKYWLNIKAQVSGVRVYLPLNPSEDLIESTTRLTAQLNRSGIWALTRSNNPSRSDVSLVELDGWETYNGSPMALEGTNLVVVIVGEKPTGARRRARECPLDS